MASEYATARPRYPRELYETLTGCGAIGPGVRVLEVGAGAGLATVDLVAAGCAVTAVEPGEQLATILSAAVPAARVVLSRLEEAELPDGAYDTVVAATSMHWVDLAEALPALHRMLRPGGWLAVWRHVFGDPSIRTPFRDGVNQVFARSSRPETQEPSREDRPTMAELSDDGWFVPVETRVWRWSPELTTDQVRRLFSTFSNVTPDEVHGVAAVADACGGVVTDHFSCRLHLLQAAPRD